MAKAKNAETDAGNDAPRGTPENPMIVQAASETAGAGNNVNEVAYGQALNPEQLAGLAPISDEVQAEEAEHREERPNRQTTWEAEAGIDPISGTPSPGVTEDAPLTARATGAPVTDMSGRPPFAGKADEVKRVRDALSAAQKEDRNADLPEGRSGWRTPAQIGVSGATLTAMYDSGEFPLEMEQVPAGHFFPETGKRYRIASSKKRAEKNSDE